jgi:hypothetical protein
MRQRKNGQAALQLAFWGNWQLQWYDADEACIVVAALPQEQAQEAWQAILEAKEKPIARLFDHQKCLVARKDESAKH